MWSKKWWIIAGGLILASIMVGIAWTTPKKYSAPLTFIINDDDGGGLSGVGAVLGELGFGGGGSKGHNYEKIIQLATSRMILAKVLTTPCEYKGTKDFLGNHILDVYQDNLPNGPINPPNFRFLDSKEKSYLADQERAVLHLSRLIKGAPENGIEPVITIDYNDESTFIEINAKTLVPELSIAIANVEYDVLSEFYVLNTIEKQQVTFNHVSGKSDSIYAELREAENQLARYRDQSSGIILNTNKLPKQQLARKIEMLYILYGESVKNKETAEFLLKNATPYFQVIDRPLGPFQPVGKSRLKAAVVGSILGGLLVIALIIGRYWFIETLRKEKTQII